MAARGEGANDLEYKPPEDLARLLAEVGGGLLGPLSHEQALWLAHRTPQRCFEPGETIYGAYYTSTILFALLEGRVRLFKSLGGEELTLEIVEAGQLFGVAPVLAGRPSEAHAEALLASRVALLSMNVIRQLAQQNPEVGIVMAQRLAERLQEYQQRMADVALQKVPARLASVLVRLFETEGVVDGHGVRIEIYYTHERLASMIGSKRVAVSRAMGELREVGAVESKGRKLYLGDEAALRRVAAEVGRRES